MYGSPPQTGGQWNPNGPQSTTSQPGQQTPQQQQQQQQQQTPQQQQQQQQHQQQTSQPPNQQSQQQQQQGSQWSPQPPNGQFTPRQTHQIPSMSLPAPPPTAMQTLQPQHQHPDAYRSLPPPQQIAYPPPYPPGTQMPYAASQPAPRQRTAIACRYCRRRKIRCSGFEQSEEGRCTNCVRFSQECVFTPVSAQTQAFVPAHTVWRGGNAPPNAQLYGAYGQPLPQNGRDPYPQHQQQPGQYPPPPQGYQGQPVYQQSPGQPLPVQAEAGRKRANDEPHTPTLPPPNPGSQATVGNRSSADAQYPYTDPSGFPIGTSHTPSSVATSSPQFSGIDRRLQDYLTNASEKDDGDRKLDPAHLLKSTEMRRANGEVKDAGVQTEPVNIVGPLK